jgi:hypothetical protein
MSRLFKYLLVPLILAALIVSFNLEASAAPNLVSTTPTPTPLNCILIKQALADGLVRLTLSGNNQLFFRKPLHYKIENLTAKAIRICFPVGLIANPTDSGDQSLMLVKDLILDLAANQILEGDLPAFCINEHKSAPTSDSEYRFGAMAKGTLLDLANAIAAQSAQERWGAQLAVWAITDQYNLNDLTATPDPNQPSLTDEIRPLFCLTQDEVILGQQLLQNANAGVSLYSGENPLTTYCQSQGIPSISQFLQRLKVLGIEAAVIVVGGALLCVAIIVGIILLAVRLARKPK